MKDELLSTIEVANQLGVTRQRVLELITDGRLPAIKVGRAYIVRSNDVASLKLLNVGRPPKPKEAAKKAKIKKLAKKSA